MNKALIITNNLDSIANVKVSLEKFVSCLLVLSPNGNYRPTKVNIEKALLWLRCNKCDSLGLLRCGHGFNHPSDTSLYLVIDLPNQNDNILTVDNKTISREYIYSNLFYAIPEGIKLYGALRLPIDSLEFKLEKTSNGTFRISKLNNIPLRADIKILSSDTLEDVDFNVGVLSILESTQSLSFSGSFCINNAFLQS